jgi:hypothetical protein
VQAWKRIRVGRMLGIDGERPSKPTERVWKETYLVQGELDGLVEAIRRRHGAFASRS